MKKFIFTLLFSTLAFSAPSYAEWTEVYKSLEGGTTYLVDDRISKHDGYVYFWELTNFQSGSTKEYKQGDCNIFRTKRLELYSYKESMGKGTRWWDSPGTRPVYGWVHPIPDSADDRVLEFACQNKWWKF